jgi:hypothetical protein
MFVAVPALLVSFLLVDERPKPTARDQVLVGTLLLAAILSIAIGGLGVVGLAIVVVLSRRRWSWLPVCGGLALVYLLYTVYNRDRILTSGAKSRNIFEVAWSMPSDIARLSSNVLEQLTVPGITFGIVLLLLAIVGLAWAARRGLLGFFEMAALVTVFVYFASIGVNRLHTIGGAETLRTANTPALLLVPALLPIVRMPHQLLAKAAVLIVAALLVLGQANDFADRSDEWTNLSSHLRAQVSAERTMLLAGEPHIAQQPRVSVASPAQILGLAHASGWASAPRAVVPLVRGKLRVATQEPRRPIAGFEAAATPLPVGGPALTACLPARSGSEPLRFALEPGLSRLLLRTPSGRPANVVLRTEDRFGTGVRPLTVTKPTGVGIVAPGRGASTLVITVKRGSVAVCSGRGRPES